MIERERERFSGSFGFPPTLLKGPCCVRNTRGPKQFALASRALFVWKGRLINGKHVAPKRSPKQCLILWGAIMRKAQN